MRARARVALVSLAMLAGLGLAGCNLSDTVSGWFDVGKLPPQDVAGVTRSVPPEIPAKKPQGVSRTKTTATTEKKTEPSAPYRPQRAEAPPVPPELVQPPTTKPQSSPLSPSAPTSAEQTSSAMSTEDWLNLCKEGSPTEQATQCFRYTRGYADALQFWWLVEQGTAKICIPSKTTSEKLRDVGVAWIQKGVQDLSEPVEVNLAMAFYEWPCRKEK